jgi:hypothetical protein
MEEGVRKIRRWMEEFNKKRKEIPMEDLFI